jgi:hypothetical protein
VARSTEVRNTGASGRDLGGHGRHGCLTPRTLALRRLFRLHGREDRLSSFPTLLGYRLEVEDGPEVSSSYGRMAGVLWRWIRAN